MKIDTRKILLLLGGAIVLLYMILYFVWYQYQSTVEFRFFDDSAEWLGMDKVGHFITAFYESLFIFYIVSFLKNKFTDDFSANNFSAIIYGWGGFVVQFPIEILDGFSSGYGFSWYDILANFLGSAWFVWQMLVWNAIKIFPKISFFSSPYSAIRPSMLGSNFLEHFIKDYNGKTAWLTFSPNNVLGFRVFPKWFLIAIGYGIDGVLGGDDNVWTDENGELKDYSHIERRWQVYLSIDIDFEELPIKNYYFNKALKIFTLYKFPLPSLEFLQNTQVLFHYVYF